MVAFEIVLIVIIVTLAIYSLFIMSNVFFREAKLQKRKCINYDNYYELKPLFHFTLNKNYIINCLVALGLNLIVLLIIAANNILNVYLPLVICLIGIVALSFILHLTSIKYNRDLDAFDKFHSVVKSSYDNKIQLENNIAIIDTKKAEITAEIDKINEKFTGWIQNYAQHDKFYILVAPLDKLKKEQELKLSAFDNSIMSVFENSIIEYLKNNGTVSASNYVFDPDKTLNIAEAIDIIVKKVKEKFILTIQETVELSKYKTPAALAELIKILINQKAFNDKYVDMLIKKINLAPKDYQSVAQVLFDNNLISYEMIIKGIDNGNDWFFNFPILKVIKNKEISELIERVIKKNNTPMANKLLIYANKTNSEFIKEGVNKAKTNNDCSTIIMKHIDLLELDSGFNYTSNRYENIALTLKDYYESVGEKTNEIDKIIYNDLFLQSKSFLESKYKEAIDEMEPLLTGLFNMMLCFSLYCSNFKLLSQSKINVLYIEYKRLLNFDGLFTLFTLLCAIVLLYSKDNLAIDLVTQNIKMINNSFDDSDVYFGNIKASIANPTTYGRNMILNLYKNHNEVYSTIINHIEAERLVIDKINRM